MLPLGTFLIMIMYRHITMLFSAVNRLVYHALSHVLRVFSQLMTIGGEYLRP